MAGSIAHTCGMNPNAAKASAATRARPRVSRQKSRLWKTSISSGPGHTRSKTPHSADISGGCTS